MTHSRKAGVAANRTDTVFKKYLGTGTATPIEGKHYRCSPPPFNPWGDRTLARPRIPIYLAAMGPRMVRLCGEKADG